MADAATRTEELSAAAAEERISWREVRALAAVLLPGLYAWGATVAWPAFSTRGAALPARLGAIGALAALLAGLALARRRPVAGRAVGVLGCLGASAVAWGALGNALRVPELDPVRALLGALGWGLFALGWGSFPARLRPAEELEAAAAARLPPRGSLPLATRIGFFAVVASAVGLPMLAWRVERPGVALLAQAVALAGSVGVASVGTRVLIARPNSEQRAAPRLGLWLCLAWLLVGVLLWLL